EINFNSHLEKLNIDGAFEGQDLKQDVDYDFVTEITEDMLPKDAALYLEFFEEDYLNANILSVAWGDDQAIYVATPDVAFESELFKQWLEDEEVSFRTYDAKATLGALYTKGIEFSQVAFDVMLASYLLTAEDSSGGMFQMSQKNTIITVYYLILLFMVKARKSKYLKTKKSSTLMLLRKLKRFLNYLINLLKIYMIMNKMSCSMILSCH